MFDSERYDRDASSCHQSVYQRKRALLLDAFESTCSPLFAGQLKNLHQTCLAIFESEITDITGSCEFDFTSFVDTASIRCEDRFKASAEEAWVEGAEWNWIDELEQLKQDVNNTTERVREAAIMEIVTAVEVGTIYPSWNLIHHDVWFNRTDCVVKSRRVWVIT